MLPLLSRPDGLPATADGVREAAVAWQELIKDLEAEKESNFAKEERKKCPFSVSWNGTGSEVEIPCGLVQDSAVTVVGVPVERNGSSRFGFELVGDRNVVVRVNVSIAGDEVVVSQSSWRVDSGWGEWEWEWCPVAANGTGANSSNLKGEFLLHILETSVKNLILTRA